MSLISQHQFSGYCPLLKTLAKYQFQDVLKQGLVPGVWQFTKLTLTYVLTGPRSSRPPQKRFSQFVAPAASAPGKQFSGLFFRVWLSLQTSGRQFLCNLPSLLRKVIDFQFVCFFFFPVAKTAVMSSRLFTWWSWTWNPALYLFLYFAQSVSLYLLQDPSSWSCAG